MSPIESRLVASGSGAPKTPPARDTFASSQTPDGIEIGALEGVRILLVEDDSGSREALELIFAYYGASVTSTDCVHDALDSFGQRPPSILVSDIGLPPSDGYALLRAIRIREHDGTRTPAIAVSGYPSNETEQRARAAGFDAFLRKPVEIHRLLKLVADLATAPAP